MENHRADYRAADPGRVTEMRLGDLLFELLRAEKYVSGDDSMSVLSVFVPVLYDAGLEARHVDIYVEFANVAEIVDVRRSLATGPELARAVEENLAHLRVIENRLRKRVQLTLVCLFCDATRKRQLLGQHQDLRIIDAAELRARLERIGIRVPANWTEGREMIALTDRLRSLSQAAMSTA